MNCDDADLMLAAAAVGALEEGETPGLRRHVAGCARCRTEGAAYARAADLLAVGVEPLTPPPDLRSRLMRQVHADVAAGAPKRGVTRDGWLRRLWGTVPAARGLTVAGGLGVAAATALAIWSFAVSHGGTGVVAVSVPNCGSASGPAATCAVRYDPSARQAVLSVRGLPRPPSSPSSRAYELWLIPPRGAPVAVGFLSPSPQGDTWTAAVSGDMSQYAALAATDEPAGGSTLPAGPEVLRVSLPLRQGASS